MIMKDNLTDLDKQRLLSELYLNKLYAPALDQIVLKVVSSIEEDKQREFSFLMLVDYLSAHGSVTLADEIARHKVDERHLGSALASIGAQIAGTNAGKAEEFLRESEALLARTEEIDYRLHVMRLISQGYMRMKDWSKARELANEMPLPSERVDSLCTIGRALWDAGETATATETLTDARGQVADVALEDRASSLSCIAKTLAGVGCTADAIEILEEAIPFADNDSEPSKILYSICKAFISLGRPERAREITNLIKTDARRAQALALFDQEKP